MCGLLTLTEVHLAVLFPSDALVVDVQSDRPSEERGTCLETLISEKNILPISLTLQLGAPKWRDKAVDSQIAHFIGPPGKNNQSIEQ